MVNGIEHERHSLTARAGRPARGSDGLKGKEEGEQCVVCPGRLACLGTTLTSTRVITPGCYIGGPIWECLCNTVSCSAPASDTHEEAQDVADP